MAIKKYIVREGFSYRTKDAEGRERVFSGGDIVDLPEELGDSHQLEIADPKARAKAAAAEDAAKAEEVAAEAARQAEADAAAAEEAVRQAESIAAAAAAEAERQAAEATANADKSGND